MKKDILKLVLKLKPVAPFQVYLSEKKNGSITSADQARHLLQQNNCQKPVVYFYHQHQAERFYLDQINSPNKINADAVITQKQNVCLAMSVADCFPVLLTSPQKNTMALVHAGWKPLLQNIIELTVLDLQHLYKLDPSRLIVWIGPGIRRCCYHFKEKPVQAELSSWQKVITKNKKGWQIDLVGFIQNELKRLGVNAKNIFDFEICTSCNSENYFSHYKNVQQKNPDGRTLVAIES